MKINREFFLIHNENGILYIVFNHHHKISISRILRCSTLKRNNMTESENSLHKGMDPYIPGFLSVGGEMGKRTRELDCSAILLVLLIIGLKVCLRP